MNERALVKVGHHVITASDGEEGLRLAIEHKPDLVVLDMLLPRLSGPEVLRAMRKDAATSSIPVMVLTSLPQCNKDKLHGRRRHGIFRKIAARAGKGLGEFWGSRAKDAQQGRQSSDCRSVTRARGGGKPNSRVRVIDFIVRYARKRPRLVGAECC
jgi:CheY-like chemotaxis protein